MSAISSRNQLGRAAQTAIQPMISPSPAGAALRHGFAGGTQIGKVTRIGGLFFRAHSPTALGRWYQQHVGISLTPSSYEESGWQQEAGPTALSPFGDTRDYFGETHKVWRVNFRVRDLDRLAAQLLAPGIAVEVDLQSYPTVGSPGCTTLREIRSNCGNLQVDLAWVTAHPETIPRTL